jgi:HAD superfamily hydrolase (TIGR01509 family)
MIKHNTDKLAALTHMTEGKFDAFLYDCDGTLADNMHLHKAAYAEVASRYGIDLDTSLIDELAGWPTVKMAEEINRRYSANLDPVSFGKEKSQVYVEQFIQKTLPIDHVVDHLKAFHGKVRIAVVSGGSRSTVEKTLGILELTPYIEVLVCAGETSKGKPYADPFLKAAELLGVAPERCVVFEDGDPGVAAAEAAGMQWIRIDQI